MSNVVLDHISKIFGAKDNPTVAVDDLELTVESGQFVSLVGPSGCGKTTTLRIIAGLEEATSGRLLFDDNDVTRLPVQRRELSMVFQNYAIFPHMTVARNVGYGLRVAKASKAEQDEGVRTAAELVGISELLNRYPRQLSGGQRQRVAVARALARNPRLVLLDEPLSNLDAKLRDQTRTELKKLHQRLGNTMIYVTHDQLEAITLSDRLAVMRDGRLQQYGTPDEIFYNPANVFVATFMGSPTMNIFDAIIEGDRSNPRALLDSGTSIALDPAVADASSAREIQVGVRPQHISLDPAPTDGDRWQVSLIEPIGTEAIVHLEHDGLTAMAMHPEPVSFSENETVSLKFSAQHVHVFDRESGERLQSSTPSKVAEMEAQ